MNDDNDRQTNAGIEDLDDLEPTAFELEQRRHELVTADNDRRARIMLRRANQKKGHTQPRPGDRYHVQLDRTIKARTRAGLRFESGSRAPVEVVDGSEDEVKLAQQAGHRVVTRHGMDRILGDDMLHVYDAPMRDADVVELKAKLAQAGERATLLEQENERILRMVRDARMAAKDSEDGSPSRLLAARKAREAAGGSAEVKFGAEPDPVKK